jgi:UDP-glucose 6-dehydrogenase
MVFISLKKIALDKGVDPTVIKIVCESDDFIGNTYNAPSFGVGGPCLMKDSRELFSKDSHSILLDSETEERHYSMLNVYITYIDVCKMFFRIADLYLMG